ncbi:TetR/AcrR family transcriptional regulator [Streptomyces sp. WM4235]|uniref:TetR/AcrR family transcriptional regulator n=1 Tax=Streptomyces sp. WM4235 TaxID=1415551 RepID=UPI0006AE4EF1|nr:TetR family transcriptional regulator [Streptomyces sp. WM4235]
MDAMSTGSPARRRRVPAAMRKELLLETALRMARESGAGSLTLAKVADACGVSKPIAYQHFTSLAGLLQAMFQRVGAEYEETVMEAMAAHRDAPAAAATSEVLRALCDAYIACTVENGALHADIGAALIASGRSSNVVHVDDAERYAGLVAELLCLEPRVAYALAAGFLGSADRLCEAVIARRLTRDEAAEVLMRLFPPQGQ